MGSAVLATTKLALKAGAKVGAKVAKQATDQAADAYQEQKQKQKLKKEQKQKQQQQQQQQFVYQGPPSLLNELPKWFDFYDVDGSGTLDREETVNALVHTTQRYSPKDIEKFRQDIYGIWSQYVPDNVGSINKTDFLRQPGGLGERLQTMYGNIRGSYSTKSIVSDITSPSAADDTMMSSSEQQKVMLRCQVPEGMKSGQTINVRSPYHGGQTITIEIPPEAMWIRKEDDGTINSSSPAAFDIDVSNIAGTTTDGKKSTITNGAGNPVVVVIINNNNGTGASPSNETDANTPKIEKWGEPYDLFDLKTASYIQTPPEPVIIPLSPSLNPIKVNGRYRGLVIGINYMGLPGELRGCINDAKNIRNTLFKAGYPNDSSHMVMLTDDNPDMNYQPTALNIIKALLWLTNDLKEGDVLFFHFSGHGVQVPDPKGMESDGMNELILPVDFVEGNAILDDSLWDLLVFQVPSGVRLTALMDCCCSGTMLDLPYQYKPAIDSTTEGSSSSLFGNNSIVSGGQSSSERSLKMRNFMDRATKEFQQGKWMEQVNPCHSRGDVVLFSGCEDGQTAKDLGQHLPLYAGGTPAEGIMTKSFIKALEETSSIGGTDGVPYPEFMASIYKNLKQFHAAIPTGVQSAIRPPGAPDASGATGAGTLTSPHQQRPQLSSSQAFDLATRMFSLTGGTVIPNHNPIVGRIKRQHIEAPSPPQETTQQQQQPTSERGVTHNFNINNGRVLPFMLPKEYSEKNILQPLSTEGLMKGGVPYDPSKEKSGVENNRPSSIIDTFLSWFPCGGTNGFENTNNSASIAAS